MRSRRAPSPEAPGGETSRAAEKGLLGGLTEQPLNESWEHAWAMGRGGRPLGCWSEPGHWCCLPPVFLLRPQSVSFHKLWALTPSLLFPRYLVLGQMPYRPSLMYSSRECHGCRWQLSPLHRIGDGSSERLGHRSRVTWSVSGRAGLGAPFTAPH